MKTIRRYSLLLLCIFIGMVAGAALLFMSLDAQATDDPLAPCTLQQRANVRVEAMEYAMEGSNPVEALAKAKRHNCK